MTVEIELIPVSTNTSLFQCALLRIGTYRILLDCGWSETMDPALLDAVPSNVDCVLLSHYDLVHCGALPFLKCSGRLDKQCRVFATEPVKRMGELTLASLHEDIDKAKDVSVSIEDIVGAFYQVTALQFNQPVVLTDSIVITAQPCGRLIGGAYWIITVGSQRIVYCVDYSLVSDRHVPGLSVLPAKRSNILITSSPIDRGVAQSLEQMIAVLKATLRLGGSAILPVDPNGRVLELLLLIEAAWNSDASLSIYPVVFLSPLGDVILDQIKTRMEWMNESVLTDFEASANFTAHPFLFNHVHLVSSLADLNEKFAYRQPKIILSTSASLEFGDSRELFARYSGDANNLILFTQFAGLPPNCLAERVAAQGAGSYSTEQFIKSDFPDEQLREIYRDKIQREATDDELRRRRRQQQVAPSSAAAVPVDLVRTSNYEMFDGTTKFFRPSLFAAQTMASSAVMKGPSAVGDYGEELTRVETDTWRANASREIESEESREGGMMKGEVVKGEVKGELVKGELGLAAGGEFDWRRDLIVRFGEPKRVSVRERLINVACRVKCINGLEGAASAVHRREFIGAVKPSNLILLPTLNTADLELIRMQVIGNFYYASQEIVLSICAEKKWITIDPSVKQEFVTLKNKSRVARLPGIYGPLPPTTPDLIQVPSGNFVEFVVAEGTKPNKRQSLLISAEPFRLGTFAHQMKQESTSVEFVATKKGRGLLVGDNGAEVLVEIKDGVLEITGTPNGNFYKVRDMLYANMTSI